MDSRPRLSSSDYWYLGSPDPAVEDVFRRVCAVAWPYAVYCATRYLHDVHAAYELMDAAVCNAESYYERFRRERTHTQLFYRVVSVLKRLSKQRVRNNREVSYGSLSNLESLATAFSTRSDAEQRAYINQVLARMTERSRNITQWRLAGHSWRQIAETLQSSQATVRRSYRKELRGLLLFNSDWPGSDERKDSDQEN